MYYLGIEIGGTKLQLGLGKADGILAGLWRETVDVEKGPEGIRRQIERAVPELLAGSGLDRSSLGGVGIGFGGPVDDATHMVIKSHQIQGWDNFPLEGWIAEVAGMPAALGNDADVAGLAEALVGAGKGLSPVFYMTIGSGIGGGLILNGEIYRGCGRGAAEVGHTPVPNPGTLVHSLPLEEVASGWAIQEQARRYFRTTSYRRDLPLFQMVKGQTESITAQHVALAARQGDWFASAILQGALDALANALCQVIALLCPRRIIIGGGVSLMGEAALFEPLRRLVAERVFKPFADCYAIVPADLGEEVVVHGALALASRRLGGNRS
jgi:glucokinase